jgi:hypothetical protein
MDLDLGQATAVLGVPSFQPGEDFSFLVESDMDTGQLGRRNVLPLGQFLDLLERL